MRKYFRYRSFQVSLAALIITIFVSLVSAQNMFRKVNDFDGDGKADYAVTRNENGLKIWYVWQSTAGFKVFHWGTGSDRNAAGDYDGDGKTDFAIWRSYGVNSTHYDYFILQSQTNSLAYRSFPVAFPINNPQQQDYDGDGKTDGALLSSKGVLPARLTIYMSSTDSFFTAFPPGMEKIIRIGDMDGDGHSDISHRPYDGNRVTINQSSTNTPRTVLFGLTSDDYVPADFDGDGTGDLTIFRPSDGSWWWLRSSDSVVNAAAWGQNGDTPVPGDYDGDGKTDLAIYRVESPQSHYWINASQTGVSVVGWGVPGDSAVEY